MLVFKVKHCVAIFSGDSPLDTAIVYGVSQNEVHHSTWMLVDEVHSASILSTCFPAHRVKQRENGANLRRQVRLHLMIAVAAQMAY